MVFLYSNGIIEQAKPKKLTYSEEELLKFFEEFEKVRSFRFVQVPGTWCLWGENLLEKDEDYSKLGSVIMGKDIFSSLCFIHDTEIDPAWKISDDPILNSYEEFVSSISEVINDTASYVIQKNSEFHQKNGTENGMILLNTIGPTNDNRVLFEYDPEIQKEEFYKKENFELFANKVYSYISEFYKTNSPFIIYADTKIIISIDNKNIALVLDKLNESFEIREEYEICAEIKNIKNYWEKKIQHKKRGRPKKNQDVNKK